MSAFGGGSVVPNNALFTGLKGNFGFNDKRNSSNSLNNPSTNGQKKKHFNKNNNRNNKPKGSNGQNNVHQKSKRKPIDKGNKGMNVDDLDDVDTLPEVKVIPKLNTKYQSHSNDEIMHTGPLIPNASQFGFGSKNIQKREVPKYLQIQPRIVTPLEFKQNAWDKMNQQKMNNMEQQNNGSDFQGLYEEFQKMRDIERKKMEELGLVDAENIRKDLNDAISFQGTCLDMCPTFERVRRALENNVKKLEKDPSTNKISKSKAVKAFSRPAAGQPPPLPSEVRPPFILSSTLNYLIDTIVPQLPDAHSFIWDRTRSIRQDFTYQNYYGPEAIDCNEKIVRIHLISLHVMAGSEVEYSQQQELEQFNKALQTLMEIYQDVRNRGGKCPNEPEFRAYYLLSHLRESEIEREIQGLPNYIVNNDLVQLAIKFRNLISQNNLVERGFKNGVGSFNLFVEFFRLVYHESTPFLMSCLLETLFNEIRFYAVKAMTRSYHTKGKAYDGETLKSMLGFDSIDELIKFIEYYEIDTINENGVILVDLVNKEKLETKYKINSINDKPKLSQAYSKQLNRKITKKFADFINSGLPNDDLSLKNVKSLKVLQANNNSSVKAGSLADFLNTPSVDTTPNTGFGAASTGFSSSAPAFGSNTGTVSNGFGANNTPNTYLNTIGGFSSDGSSKGGFSNGGFSNGGFSNQSSKNGGFTQSKPPNEPAAVFVPQSDIKPTIKEPNFLFSTKIAPTSQSKPTKSFSFNQPESTPSVQGLKPTLLSLNSKFTNEPSTLKLEAPKIASNASSLTTSTTSAVPVTSIPKPIAQKAKTIKDSQQFDTAVREIMEELLKQTVDEELVKNIPRVIKYENDRRERSRIIDLFSNELYEAFLSELTFKALLETRAEYYYKKTIKTKYIKKIKEIGTKYERKLSLKRKRQDELNEIKFNGLNGLKRQLSGASSMSSKRRHVWNETSIDEIVDKRNEIEKLWQPINFKQFLDSLNANLLINISIQHIDLKFLVLVENFKLNYSRWLVNKLGLKVNKEKMYYENLVHLNKINLQVVSLPNKKDLNKEFFSNIPFVLFESGFVDKTESSKFKDINEKLVRDSLILKKILGFANKYDEFKIQILIIYWDITNSKLTAGQIESALGVPRLKQEYSNVINQITICDMSQTNINEIINDGFVKLGHDFTGELTPKGKKKKLDVHENKKPEFKTVDNDRFKNMESKIINRAKMEKKYSYLNNHSIVNQSLNPLVNQLILGINKTNRTMNRTFGNRTISNSHLLDTTFINNSSGSLLGGFGKEIIEESTPFNSPKKSFFAVDLSENSAANLANASQTTAKATGKPPVPKSLQQLIDLTSKVKSKYK